jgi:hypothetical protein
MGTMSRAQQRNHLGNPGPDHKARPVRLCEDRTQGRLTSNTILIIVSELKSMATPRYVTFYFPYMRKTLTIKSVFYRLYDLYFRDIYKPIVGRFFYLPSHYFPPVRAT